jgi:eukaryotic-like serine/threonine-protein kinase
MILCPFSGRLPQFLDRQLGEEASQEIVLHVEDCPFCIEELERLTASDGKALPLPPVRLGDSTGPDSAPTANGELPAIPGYLRLRVLRRGGQSIVYLADDARLPRRVALKMIRAGSGAGPRDLARFRIEMEAHVRLQHPNIIPIYQVGEYQDQPFFTEEYANGGSLKDRLKDGLPPPRDAARLVETLARAIHYAHQRGVLHRDLKPANVLLQDVTTRDPKGQEDQRTEQWDPKTQRSATLPRPPSCLAWVTATPKITDFGLAKFLDAEPDQTCVSRKYEVLGTARYMAPEQAAGKVSEVGTLTDVYGLGAVLYEVLTGHAPFEGASDEEILSKVRSDGEVPPPPRRWRREVPADLELICLKCLEKEPARRYASAGQLADELGRFLRGEALAYTRRVGPGERLWRWCRRNPSLAAVGVLAVSLLVAVTALSLGWAVHARHANLRMQEQLAERHFDLALADCERGEVGFGVLGMARSLETAPDSATDLCRTLRASLSAWRSQLLPLTDCRPATGKLLAFDPDGLTVWVADGPAVCRRLISTGEPVGAALPHDSAVRAVASSQDGDVVLTLAGQTVRLWDSATGKPGPSIKPPGVIDAVALSPDGQTVLTAIPRDGQSKPTIRRWDARTGEELVPSYHYENTAPPALALSPDGRTLLATQQGAIYSWDVATGKPLGPLPIHRGLYSALAYAPDGRRLLTGSRNYTAQLWDINTGRPLARTLYHGGPVQSVAWSRDGQSLFTADTSPAIRVWAVEEGPLPARVFPHDNPVRTVAISPDGQLIAAGTTGDHAGTVRLWNKAQGTLLREMPHDVGVAVVLFSPDGRSLVTADCWISAPSSVRLWDCASGEQKVAPLRHGKCAHALAFTPDGRLLVGGSYDGNVDIWDAASGAPRDKLAHGEQVLALALDSQGKRMVTGSSDGMAGVWDLHTLRLLGECLPHRKAVRAVAFSPQGDRVLTASDDGTARLWDAASCQPVGRPMEHGGDVWVARFSPNGRRILTGSLDGTGRLWDAATGEPLGKPLAHDDQVWAAAFSPDGHWVATASWDGTGRLWDAATGRPLGPPLPHTDKVWAIAFDPQSQMLLTGAEDNQARLWRIPAPLEGSVERVVLWAQVLTGMELDAGGGSHVLDTQTWQQRRQQLALQDPRQSSAPNQ